MWRYFFKAPIVNHIISSQYRHPGISSRISWNLIFYISPSPNPGHVFLSKGNLNATSHYAILYNSELPTCVSSSSSTWQSPSAQSQLHKEMFFPVWCERRWLSCTELWPQPHPTPFGMNWNMVCEPNLITRATRNLRTQNFLQILNRLKILQIKLRMLTLLHPKKKNRPPDFHSGSPLKTVVWVCWSPNKSPQNDDSYLLFTIESNTDCLFE